MKVITLKDPPLALEYYNSTKCSEYHDSLDYHYKPNQPGNK